MFENSLIMESIHSYIIDILGLVAHIGFDYILVELNIEALVSILIKCLRSSKNLIEIFWQSYDSNYNPIGLKNIFLRLQGAFPHLSSSYLKLLRALNLGIENQSHRVLSHLRDQCSILKVVDLNSLDGQYPNEIQTEERFQVAFSFSEAERVELESPP